MGHIQIITERGRKMAVIPLAAYNRMIARLEAKEDAADIRSAKMVLARVKAGKESLVPSEVVKAIVLKGQHPVKAWRIYRKLTATTLAAAADISRPYLTQIENRSRKGTASVLRALAGALATDMDALMDEQA